MIPLSAMVILVALQVASVFVAGIVLAGAIGVMIALLMMQLTCHFLGMVPSLTMA